MEKNCLQHIHSIVMDGLPANIHTTRLEPWFSSIITNEVYWNSWNILKGIFVAIISSYVVPLVEMNNNHAENNLEKIKTTQNAEMCTKLTSIPLPLKNRFWTSSIQRLICILTNSKELNIQYKLTIKINKNIKIQDLNN